MSVEGSIMLDEHLLSEIISFCDFQTLVKTRRTSVTLKKLSDQALDTCVDVINQKGLPCGHEISNDWISERTQIRIAWTLDFRSRASLMDMALEQCSEWGGSSGEDYDRDRARWLLDRNNMVDARNFLNDEHDGPVNSEGTGEGWTVRFWYNDVGDDVAKKTAIELIMREVHGEDAKRIVLHETMCLLRKSTYFKFSKLQYDYHQSDNRHGGCKISLMLKTRMNVEFLFSCYYQVP